MGLVFLQFVVLGALVWAGIKVSGRGMNAETAFAAPWLLSVGLLVLNPGTADFLTVDGVMLVLGVHICFFVFYATISVLLRSRGLPRKSQGCMSPSLDVISRRELWVLRLTWWVATPLALTGAALALQNTNMVEMVATGMVAATRGDVLQGAIYIPIHIRILCNFLYLSALVGALIFKYRGGWSALLAPAVGLLVYSLSTGGRGAVLIGGGVIGLVLINGGRLGLRVKLGGFFVVSVFLIYIYYIAMTRPGFDPVMQLANVYGPIPALCQLMQRGDGFPLAAFDLTDSVFYREVSSLLGFRAERSIETNVVSIPFTYNVYTFIADLVKAGGYIGLGVFVAIIAAISAFVDSLGREVVGVSVRSVVYLYLGYTIYTDLSLFLAAWWLLVVYCFIVYASVGRRGSGLKSSSPGTVVFAPGHNRHFSRRSISS